MDIMHLGKKVGVVRYGEYHTFRNKTHFMRMFQGFGVSDAVLSKLQREGISVIKFFYDGKEKCVFKSSVEQFIRSILRHVDNGDGQQFVPTGMMRKFKWHGNK